MGSAVALMQRWRQDSRCLLVLPQTGIHAKLSLAPFQPLLMKVLHYSRGGKLGEVEVSAIIGKLKPELSLLPETMMNKFKPMFHEDSDSSQHTAAFYTMWDILTIPGPPRMEVDMGAEVACSIHPKLLDSGMAVSHVAIRVRQKEGKWMLDIPELQVGECADLIQKEEICWGSVEVTDLLHILQGNGLSCDVSSHEQNNSDGQIVQEYCIVISSPSPAKVELRPNCTVIDAADAKIRRVITDAVKSSLTCV